MVKRNTNEENRRNRKKVWGEKKEQKKGRLKENENQKKTEKC